VVALLFRSFLIKVATIVGGLSSALKAVVKYLPYINKGVLVVYKGLCDVKKINYFFFLNII